MFCQFLLYSKVTQLYIYIHSFFFALSSIMFHHKWLDKIPCAIHQGRNFGCGRVINLVPEVCSWELYYSHLCSQYQLSLLHGLCLGNSHLGSLFFGELMAFLGDVHFMDTFWECAIAHFFGDLLLFLKIQGLWPQGVFSFCVHQTESIS